MIHLQDDLDPDVEKRKNIMIAVLVLLCFFALICCAVLPLIIQKP